MVSDILLLQSDSAFCIALFFRLSIALLGFSTVTLILMVYIVNQGELEAVFQLRQYIEMSDAMFKRLSDARFFMWTTPNEKSSNVSSILLASREMIATDFSG